MVEGAYAYKSFRLLVISVNIVDASIILAKSSLPVDGLTYRDRQLLDPYYGNLAAIASLSLLCIFISLLLHHARYASFFCIFEIIWTFCTWVVWFTFGIIAASLDCLGIQPICNVASLLAGLAFLNWFLLLVLNISISMHVNTQRKGGNHNIWYQMPFRNATVVMQTTSVPLEPQAPAGPQPSIVQSGQSHPSINPALGDGRDVTTVDRRLGDGSDNA